MWHRERSRIAVIGGAFAVFVVCCVLPVGYLLLELIDGSAAYRAVLLDARQRGLLYNTALLGTGTAALATAIGTPMGVALARIPMRRKSLLRVILAAPVVLPPYVAALAFVYVAAGMYGSLPAAVLVLSLAFYPITMLATELAMRRIDGRLEEAALLVAAPRTVLWRITLPMTAPAILAAALTVFVLAISEFGVPGLLQVRVYTTEVFTAFAALYDFSRAMLLATPLLLLSIVVAATAAIAFGDRLVTTRRSIGVSPVAFASWRPLAISMMSLVIATATGVPLVSLVAEAANARSLSAVFAGSGEAITNSLWLAALGATLVVAVAAWIGSAQARAGRRWRLATQALLVSLFAVPSTIIGVGLIGLWNRPEAAAIYGTDTMFLLAYLARFIPVAVLILAATMSAVPVAQEEAAIVSGAGWLETMCRIVLPQVKLGIAGAWVIVFVLAFGELGVSILVAPPGETTLPIRIYTIIANTPPSHVAALALLQSLVIFTPLVALGVVRSLREAR
jgi:iron(III) transport system permease protein